MSGYYFAVVMAASFALGGSVGLWWGRCCGYRGYREAEAQFLEALTTLREERAP
jgi:hypothetical protein